MPSARGAPPLRSALPLILCALTLFLATISDAVPMCEEFAGSPPACTAFVDYALWVDTDNPFANQGVYAHFAASAARQALLLPEFCAVPTLKVLCGRAFANCSQDVPYLPLPRKVCRQTCEEWMLACSFILAQLDPSQIVNCSAVIDPLDGQRLYPDEYSIVVLPIGANGSDVQVQVPCYNPQYDASIGLPDLGCPKHFSKVDDYDGSDPTMACLPTCPYAVWSDEHYEALVIYQAVLGFLSMLLTGVIIIPWMFDLKRLRFPQNMPLMQLITVLALAFVSALPAMYDYKDILCEDDTTPADQSHAVCAFQATILYISTLAGYMWWAMQCVYLAMSTFTFFQQRIMNNAINMIVLQVLFHVICWGYPAIPFIVVASNEKLAAVIPGVACLVDAESADGWWLYGSYTLLIQIPVCLSTIALIVLFIRLVIRFQIQFLKSEIRLIIYAVYYLVTFWMLMLYNWLIRGYKDTIEEGAENWFTCLATDFYLNGGNGDDCELEDQPPDGLDWFIRVLTSLPLIVVPFIFGATWSTYHWYKNFLAGLFLEKRLVLSSVPSDGIGSGTSSDGMHSGMRSSKFKRVTSRRVQGKKLDLSTEMGPSTENGGGEEEKSSMSSSEDEFYDEEGGEPATKMDTKTKKGKDEDNERGGGEEEEEEEDEGKDGGDGDKKEEEEEDEDGEKEDTSDEEEGGSGEDSDESS